MNVTLTVMEWLLVAVGVTGGLTLLFLASRVGRLISSPPSITVHFSPKGGCADAILKEVRAARREVLVQAFAFGCRPLAQALIDAKLRGLRVDILLDWAAEKDAGSDLKFFLEQGLTPLINAQFLSAHDKIMLIDGRTLITGSFDFTQQAEEDNAENLLVIKGHGDVVKVFRDRFETMKAKCQAPGIKPGEVVKKAG